MKNKSDPIRHKINEFTNAIACGNNPDMVVYTERWDKTNCDECLKNKGKVRSHPMNLLMRRKKQKPLGKMGLKLYGTGLGDRVERSLFNKFKTKQPKKLPFGDTFNMPTLFKPYCANE